MSSAGRRPSVLAVICANACLWGSHWRAAAAEQGQDALAATLTKTLMDDAGAGVALAIPCGDSSIAQSIAAQLIGLGPTAIPPLEDALNFIEVQDLQGIEIPNARLILDSYLRIRGRAAYPRLQKMIESATMPSLQIELDDSVASLLGLTSAVSFRPGKTSLRTDSISSCRSPTPRDSLDRLIVAWNAGNRPAVEASLSPSARNDLGGLLAGKTWESFRAGYWRASNDQSVTVGYRFLSTSSFQGAVPVEIPTTLETVAGRACGTLEIKFSSVPLAAGTSGPRRYLVDGPGLAALLRLISSCASEAGREP